MADSSSATEKPFFSGISMSKNSTSVGLRVISRKASTPVCADTISGVIPYFLKTVSKRFSKTCVNAVSSSHSIMRMRAPPCCVLN